MPKNKYRKEHYPVSVNFCMSEGLSWFLRRRNQRSTCRTSWSVRLANICNNQQSHVLLSLQISSPLKCTCLLSVSQSVSGIHRSENLLRLWQNLSILSDMSVEFCQSLFRLALCVHFANTSGRIAAEPRPELMSQNYYYMTATKPGGMDFLCKSIIKTIEILKEGGGSGG